MRPLPLAALCFLVTMGSAMATQFTRGEIYTAQQWAAALFSDGVMGGPEAPSLSVERNNDAVQLMGRNDGPLTLGGKRYHRGIFAHADSRIVVRLPRPAGRFLATVGVDSNRDTLGGRGSVTFRVVTDEPLWESALMREGAPPIEVACDLGGATAFALEVTDGGDGIACDQADWADARVEMADGSSRSSTLGRLATERASATRWRCPPESWCGLRLAKASSLTSFSISATRFSISGAGMPSCFSPKAMFFSTVMWGNSA